MAQGHDSWEEARRREAEAKYEEIAAEYEELYRMAIGVMETLEDLNQDDFVLIKNPKARTWWYNHKTKMLKEAKTRLQQSEKLIKSAERELQDAHETNRVSANDYEILKEKLKL